MTSHFLLEANKLKNAENFIEKNENYSKCLTLYGAELNLDEFYQDLKKKRTIEIEKCTNELKDIVQTLHAKKKVLKTEDVNLLDLNAFKKEMIELQEKIQQFKIMLKTNGQKLTDQEKLIEEELEPFNRKISEWERPIKYFSSFQYKSHSTVIDKGNFDKEVKDFMDFVEKSNGHENGWSSEDHQLFLKMRNKFKNIDVLAQNLRKSMPDMTVEDIKNHELWYVKYLHLKSKKHEALDRWRQSKNSEKSKENQQNNNQESIPPIKYQIKPKNKHVEAKLAEWKAQKQLQQQQIRLAQQIQKEQLKIINEEKRKMHEKIKQSVEQWKETKLAGEQMRKIQQEIDEYREKKQKAYQANKLIKQFQSKDDIYVMRMRSSRQSEKQQLSRSKSSTISNRDPQRLFKPTKQWILRTCKDETAENEPIPIPNIRIIPKLRVPEWRK